MRIDRRGFVGLLAGPGAGGRQVRAFAADQALDVQLLQTAASIENVLVSAYDTILGLPAFTANTANAVFKNLATTARAQHADHAAACNELAGKLGGRPQTGANPFLAQAVTRARPALNDLGPAVDLALLLETASAHTYQFDIGLLTDLNARRMAASVLGVESEHVGLLRVIRALLAARTPEFVTLDSGNATRLPPEASTAGFPEPFAKPEQARPAAEGAVG